MFFSSQVPFAAKKQREPINKWEIIDKLSRLRTELDLIRIVVTEVNTISARNTCHQGIYDVITRIRQIETELEQCE